MTSGTIPAKILIADDDPTIHEIICSALSGFKFENQPVRTQNACSGREAVETLQQQPDIAVVLLNSALGNRTGGLETVKAIRENLDNPSVRIIVRMEQHGPFTERDVISAYDISGLISETELTDTRLFTAVYSALRTYFSIKKAGMPHPETDGIQKPDKQGKNRYQDLPVMIHSINEAGRLVDVNDHWLSTLKYQKEDVIGRPLTLFFTEESKTYAEKVVLPEFWKKGKVIDVPYQMVDKNGAVLKVLLSATLEPGQPESNRHSTAVIRDITPQHQAEQALRTSEQRLSLAVKGGNLGFWDWDMNSNTVTYNNRWADIIGYTINEIEPTYDAWESRTHPDDKIHVTQNLTRHSQGDTPFFEAEHRLKTKDGSWRWVMGVGKISQTDSKGIPVRMTGIMIDINRQKQAEQRLARSEERFRNVALTSGDWIWEIDEKGRYTYASKSIKDILGFRPEALLGKTPFDLMVPEDASRIQDVFMSIMAEKAPIIDLENWNLTKTGQQVCLLTNGVPLINEQGRLTGYLGVAKDITARKNAQEKIQQNLGELTALNRLGREINAELSLEAVLDHAIVPVAEAVKPALAIIFLVHEDRLVVRQQYSFDLNILDCNDAGILNIGRPLCKKAFEEKKPFFTTDLTTDPRFKDTQGQEPKVRGFAAIPLIIGRATIGVMAIGCLTLRRFETRGDFLFSMAEILAAGINNSFLHERIQQYAGFLEKSVEKRTRELTQTNRQLKIEIEDRKAMALELEKREEMLNKTGTMARVGGWEMELADDKLVWTRTVFDIHQLGLDYEPRIDSAIEFYIPEHREKIRTLVNRCRHHGTPYDGEFEIITARGNRIWVRAKGEAVYQNGQITKLIGSFQDISDRKKTEAELLLAKEEAEKANMAKTEFLARMSHEIRTPMNAILNLTDFVLGTRLTKEQKDYLDLVRQSGRHLLNIINDILDLSKIESGRMEMESTIFDLAMVLETTIASLSQQAKEKGLFLETKIEGKLPAFFKGDPNRLQQVLLNLTGNAIKFTQTGGITISVSSSEIQYSPPKGQASGSQTRLLFRIEDTGIGIEDKHKDVIFQAFGQADISTSREYGGTGLGLTISRQIIELMNGDIWFASEPGQGTVFHFSLCMEKGNAADLTAKIKNRNTFRDRTTPAKILLAEDNIANIKVARAMIGLLGHELSTARNGQETLELLRREKFDFVLMDVEMPVMDGFTTTKEIRAGKAGEQNRDIRIIALTAHALTGYREKCLAAGMNHYISKPFELNELARVIGRVGSGNSRPGNTGPSEPEPPENKTVLDSGSAVRRLYGDTELYHSLCNDFLKKYPGQLDEIHAHIHDGAYKKAAILAHTLKGNCGNIGAVACERYAGELETAVRKKDIETAENCFKKLSGAVIPVRNIIYARQKPTQKRMAPSSFSQSTPHGTAAEPLSFTACLRDLKKTLRQGRENETQLRAVSDQWPAGMAKELLLQLIDEIDNFDFAQALETLGEIEQTLAIEKD